MNLSAGFLLLHWFFDWKILPCFPKHKINESNLIANYYSLRRWRDQSLKVLLDVPASDFCPFFLQFFSLITTGSFITVMSTKSHQLHRHKKVLSQSKETHLWGCYHGVFHWGALEPWRQFYSSICSTHFSICLTDTGSYPTVKSVLSRHRIKRTPSIKWTVAKVPKFISLNYLL